MDGCYVSWFFFFPVILENNTLTENLTNNNSLYNGITSSKTNLIIFVKKLVRFLC
jgi:hypothetical protein